MKAKLLIQYILQFLFPIFLFFFIILTMLFFTVFNPKYILKTFEKCDYYTKLQNTIDEEMNNYIIQSGFDESVLNNIYPKEDLKKQVRNIVYSMYRHDTYKVDTKTVETNLKQNINEYLSTNNIVVNDEESISKFIEKMAEVYEENIHILKSITMLDKLLYFGKISCLIGSITLFVIVILLYIILKKIYKVNCLSTTLFTNAILLFMTCMYFYNRLDINHINLLSASFSSFIMILLKNMLIYLLELSLITIMLGMTTVVIENNKKE